MSRPVPTLPLRRTLLGLGLTAVALTATSCGSSSGSGSSLSGSPATPTAGPSTPAETAPGVDPSIAAVLAKKPVIEVPDTPAPATTTTRDIVLGTGLTAKAGDTVDVKYVGVLYKTGAEFDSSWKTSADNTFSFTVGQGQVIPGFDTGVVGMKVGGRREIIIPSAEGYGAQGSPPSIPANSDLIFVIDLVALS